MYPIIEVPEHATIDTVEQLGTKFKFWYDDNQILFKEGRPDGGEHWSEKAACEIARLLGLPHASYDLARWRGRIGVVSSLFIPKGGRLVVGNELLGREVENYIEAREHRVSTVMALLRSADIKYPLGFEQPPAMARACDVFVGYLMLDALIANQDRHHENWGYVELADGSVHLAPTFDHASSLGRNDSDKAREDRLTTTNPERSVERYVLRAKSAFLAAEGDGKRLTTLEAFEWAAKYRPQAAKYWLERLGACEQGAFEAVFAEMPPEIMSDTAKRFAISMIQANRRRLLA